MLDRRGFPFAGFDALRGLGIVSSVRIRSAPGIRNARQRPVDHWLVVVFRSNICWAGRDAGFRPPMMEDVGRCRSEGARFVAVDEMSLAHDFVGVRDNPVNIADVLNVRRIDEAHVMGAAAIERNIDFARRQWEPARRGG